MFCTLYFWSQTRENSVLFYVFGTGFISLTIMFSSCIYDVAELKCMLGAQLIQALVYAKATATHTALRSAKRSSPGSGRLCCAPQMWRLGVTNWPVTGNKLKLASHYMLACIPMAHTWIRWEATVSIPGRYHVEVFVWGRVGVHVPFNLHRNMPGFPDSLSWMRQAHARVHPQYVTLLLPWSQPTSYISWPLGTLFDIYLHLSAFSIF